MKINIIGLPASGKTTLAANLTKTYSLPCLNLDTHIFKLVKKKRRVRVSSDTYLKTIKRFMKRKNWIIEGIYTFDEVIKEADIIIFVERSFSKLIYLQWKRFFTNKSQRLEYGFISNLKLSWFIYNLYFNKVGVAVYDNQKPLTISDIHTKLSKYKKKVQIMRTGSEMNMFVASLNAKKLFFICCFLCYGHLLNF